MYTFTLCLHWSLCSFLANPPCTLHKLLPSLLLQFYLPFKVQSRCHLLQKAWDDLFCPNCYTFPHWFLFWDPHICCLLLIYSCPGYTFIPWLDLGFLEDSEMPYFTSVSPIPPITVFPDRHFNECWISNWYSWLSIIVGSIQPTYLNWVS